MQPNQNNDKEKKNTEKKSVQWFLTVTKEYFFLYSTAFRGRLPFGSVFGAGSFF